MLKYTFYGKSLQNSEYGSFLKSLVILHIFFHKQQKLTFKNAIDSPQIFSNVMICMNIFLKSVRIQNGFFC